LTKTFFEERSDQSEVKARIVQKYFFAWCKVIMPWAERVAYIDLYAGPGRYRDGAASTPLLILQQAISDTVLSQKLVAIFNDADPNHTNNLEKEISSIPGVKKLKHLPTVNCAPVDSELADTLNQTSLIPSFSFVDPFGYKGLSLRIVNGVIKDWGCDCVFFFNYNRINAGISNPLVEDHMNQLFGVKRANKLRATLPSKSPTMREALILEELAQAIKEMGGAYVLPFRFKNSAGTRTSHSLIFVSKAFVGYHIMKGIMAKESSTTDQGVPSFTYSPADASMPLLMSLQRPLSQLRGMLKKNFAGKTLTMKTIYETHSVDTPYIDRNYKDVLLKMEEAGEITVTSATGKRRANTFADHLIVSFPK
jgi:three-Cys-motif partner protein